MNKIFLASFAAAAVLPFAGIGLLSRTVVNPGEQMVTVPGLEHLGPSRVSSVRFCSHQLKVGDWRQLMTDSEFEGMEACLQDLT
jgi:hypothetical protein